MCRTVAGSLLVLLAVSTTPALAGGAAWGTIKSTTPDQNQFVLVQDGKDKLYTLTDDAVIHRVGKEAKLTDLKAGDDVVVLYVSVKDGLYAFNVRNAPEHWGNTMKGQMKAVKSGQQFVLTSDGKDYLFTLADKGIVATNVKNGNLNDLKSGTNLSVQYVKLRGGLYATMVRTEAR